jgi:ABC-type long-subunit fatty acid transport system fused permease/ATPase subunit
MGSKEHFSVSFIKSIIRLIGCITVLFGLSRNMDYANALALLCIMFFLAELLGIGEEFVDKR